MKNKTIVKIIKELNKLYSVKPWRENPFKVLITTILSQRTKDEVTRKASDQLFRVADTPEKILKLSEKKIVKLIYPTGFYKQKTKRIKEICKILVEKYNGKVPNAREELMQLPGVGWKTSNVVLCYAFGKPVIPVDVHVEVCSKRLGLVPEDADIKKIEERLEKLVPENKRILVNHLFVEFGKEICRTIKPKCEPCPIKKYCEFYHLKS